MAKQKRYACSLQASMYGWHADHAVWTCVATSHHAARDLAMAEALRRWPTEKEYRHHSVKTLLLCSKEES